MFVVRRSNLARLCAKEPHFSVLIYVALCLREMVRATDEVQKQVTSNLNALPHFEAFAEFRNRLTGLLATRAAPDGGSRLCLLGAGNCYDADLERLASLYREVHLVDIDPEALDRAWERQSTTVRARLVRHPPVDLSGVLDQLARWRELDVTAEELMNRPGAAVAEIASALPNLSLIHI